MKKLRNWGRSKRQTRSKTRQHEALLSRAMEAPSNQQSGPDRKELSIFLNDFTDSDNDAAALLWACSLEKHRDRKGIYIAEPRWVNFGYYMTSRDFGRCLGVVAKLDPPLGELPLKTVLAGRMTEEIIKSRKVDGMSLYEESRREDLELLRRCIRPKNGEKEDAVMHAHLLTMDFLSTMKTRCSRHFDVLVDNAALEPGNLESPINLKTSYHEELVFRTSKELGRFQDILAMSTGSEEEVEKRRDSLRDWYSEAIDRKIDEFGGVEPYKDMKSYDLLFDEMRNYDKIIFFGGSSLTILSKILEKEPSLAGKIHYYQQGGTFDSSINILGSPLNFALNKSATEFVFREDQVEKLAGFTLIPTDTTKKLEFTVKGLKAWSPAIGLHSLSFYGRMDPWELITHNEGGDDSASTADLVNWRSQWVHDPKYDDPGFKGYKAVMADLVAFLVSFTTAFEDFKTSEGSLVVRKTNIGVAIEGPERLLIKDESSHIKALMLEILEPDTHGKAVVVEEVLEVIDTAMRSI